MSESTHEVIVPNEITYCGMMDKRRVYFLHRLEAYWVAPYGLTLGVMKTHYRGNYYEYVYIRYIRYSPTGIGFCIDGCTTPYSNLSLGHIYEVDYDNLIHHIKTALIDRLSEHSFFRCSPMGVRRLKKNYQVSKRFTRGYPYWLAYACSAEPQPKGRSRLAWVGQCPAGNFGRLKALVKTAKRQGEEGRQEFIRQARLSVDEAFKTYSTSPLTVDLAG